MSKRKWKAAKKAAKKLGVPFKNLKLKKVKPEDFLGFPVPKSWVHAFAAGNKPEDGASTALLDEFIKQRPNLLTKKQQALYNLAADYVIERDLRKSGVNFMDEVPNADEKTTEQIYEALKRHETYRDYYSTKSEVAARIWKQTSATTWTWKAWEITFHDIAGLYSVAFKGSQIPMKPFEELSQAQAYCE